MANMIGAAKYFECSAKTGQGIKEIFKAAAKWAVKPKSKANNCRML